jgi:hypothetical protein
MERTIGCDDAINEIAEILIQADGEWITEIYNKVSGKKATYDGDNLITVEDKEEEYTAPECQGCKSSYPNCGDYCMIGMA